MSRYTVTVDHDEEDVYLVWVHELPGCHAYGTTREEALADVVGAIERFRAWLRAAGEEVSDEPVEFDIVEAADVAEMPSGVLLTGDQAALTPEGWTRVERWLHYSRRELLRALENMREEDLQTAAGEGSRSVAAQLRHLAAAEYSYALWTFDFRSKQGLKELLDWTRRMATERMRVLAGRGDNRLTRAEWSRDEPPEPWTARKAARRLVYHERWHLNSIRRLLQGFRGRDASGGPAVGPAG
jgi:predicted RNase H-like HicB family nuclease